jgi:hypothetical protein
MRDGGEEKPAVRQRVPSLKRFVHAGRFGDREGRYDCQNKKGRVGLFPFYFFLFPPEDSYSSLAGWD